MQEFDKLISDAAPTVPDSGPSRRQTHALLREKTRQRNHSKRRQNWSRLSIAASLVLMFVLGWQVTDLGGDDFGLRPSNFSGGDSASTVYETNFGNTSFSTPESWNEGKVREYQQSVAAGEGRIIRISGVEIDGKTKWSKRVERMVEGELNTGNMTPHDPPSDISEHHLPFVRFHLKNAYHTANTTPPQRTATVEIDGVAYDFGVWEFEVEEVGEVTLYYIKF